MVERRDVIKNKKAILQGYIDMTNEKAIDKITVSDVIKKANVSRATFYAHYSDIAELKNRFENDFMNMMMKLTQDSVEGLFRDPQQSVFNIFSSFDKNKKMIRAISGNGSSDSFFLLYKNALKEQISKIIRNGETVQKEVVAFTISSIITDNCREIVLANRKKITIAIRASIVSKFIPKK